MFNIIESENLSFREFYDHEDKKKQVKNYELALVLAHRDRWGTMGHILIEDSILQIELMEKEDELYADEIVSSICNYYFNVLERDKIKYGDEIIEKEDYNKNKNLKSFYLYNGSIDEGGFEFNLDRRSKGAQVTIKNMNFEKLEDYSHLEKEKKLDLSEEEFLDFERSLLETIDPSSWDMYYSGDLYLGKDVLLKGCAYDGGNWEIVLDYTNHTRDIRKGKIDYPHNFEELETLLFDLYKN